MHLFGREPQIDGKIIGNFGHYKLKDPFTGRELIGVSVLVKKNVKKVYRMKFHEIFFETLKKEKGDTPLMAYIQIRNDKSLNLFKKNGFRPVFLCFKNLSIKRESLDNYRI